MSYLNGSRKNVKNTGDSSDTSRTSSENSEKPLHQEIERLKEQLKERDELIQEIEDSSEYVYDPYGIEPVRNENDLTDNLLRKIDILVDDLRQKDTMLKQLMKAQSEERNKQFEERERTDTIIMKLSRDLEDYRKAALMLEDKINLLVDKRVGTKGEEFRKCFDKSEDEEEKRKHSKVVTLFCDRADDPEKDLERLRKMMNIDPLAGKNFFQRIFIKIFKPELLRKAN